MPSTSSVNAPQQSNKRKFNSHDTNQQPHKRYKTVRDARTIRTQPSDVAYKNGELDVASFVQAREFEIRALEESLRKTRNAPTTRAFQQVPREMRRRAASHNVKKVPKRLRRRAVREMAEDNTPTVNAKSRRKEAGSKMRLRIDTAKRLQRLTQKANASKAKRAQELLAVSVTKDGQMPKPASVASVRTAIKVRLPRVKKNMLQKRPQPPAKFAKRQRNKTWLPTHLYHTKRAHMIPSRSPLWGWAIPLTPTMKGYRATHRASSEKGGVAWDTSYISTIGLEGRAKGIEGLLRALGIGSGGTETETWGKRGQKWRDGKRAWHGWLHERQKWPRDAIAPVSLIWGPNGHSTKSELPLSSGDLPKAAKQDHGLTSKRKLFLRIHPSAFARAWEEVLRVAKVQKPAVMVEDLRFEIGSIDILGPQGFEALAGTLHEYDMAAEKGTAKKGHQQSQLNWQQLCCCTNPKSLPNAFVIPLEVVDPRLSFPPRKIDNQRLTSTSAQQNLLQMAAEWPWDRNDCPKASIFDRLARLTGARLPTQKSIDRRNGAGPPGKPAGVRSTDPRIPALIYATAKSNHGASTLTILLPWKCILPVWRTIMYYPLSTGGQVSMGCLEQRKQVCFEAGTPWFPGDFPGTRAGDTWGRVEQENQHAIWERTPKAKRVSFEALRLTKGQKGELGRGWCCDWQFLSHTHALDALLHVPSRIAQLALTRHIDTTQAADRIDHTREGREAQEDVAAAGLVVIRLTLLSKGAPKTNARIYRLPSSSNDAELRKSWLTLQPMHTQRKSKQSILPPTPALLQPSDLPTHVRNQHLAASLLQPPWPETIGSPYPSVPDKADLIGFVTSGNYNLAHGLGTAVGSILLRKALNGAKGSGKTDERMLCIVRNAGEVTGRLARWELA